MEGAAALTIMRRAAATNCILVIWCCSFVKKVCELGKASYGNKHVVINSLDRKTFIARRHVIIYKRALTNRLFRTRQVVRNACSLELRYKTSSV